jgi:hypothetical protein
MTGSLSLTREDFPKWGVRLFLKVASSTVGDSCLDKQVRVSRLVVFDITFEPGKHLARSSAFVHVLPLFSPPNILSTGFVILVESITGDHVAGLAPSSAWDS